MSENGSLAKRSEYNCMEMGNLTKVRSWAIYPEAFEENENRQEGSNFLNVGFYFNLTHAI